MTAKRVTGTVTAPRISAAMRSNKIMEYIGNGANYKAKYLY